MGSDYVERSALALARKIRETHGATFGIAVGPPTHDDVEVAWHDESAGESLRIKRGGHPAVEVARVAKSALNLLRRHLLKVNHPG